MAPTPAREPSTRPQAADHAPVPEAAPARQPSPVPAADREAHERAHRLARVLVSDILVYNQEARDQSLRQGNLASALAGEINKAWELYKTKIDPEVLHSSSYFKDALNEILANGQSLF